MIVRLSRLLYALPLLPLLSVACGDDPAASTPSATGGTGGTGGSASSGAAGALAGGKAGGGATGGSAGSSAGGGGSAGTTTAGNGGAAGAGTAGNPALCAEPTGTTKAKLRILPGTGSLDSPIAAKTAPGDDGRLFIASKKGEIRIHQNGKLLAEPFYTVKNLTIGDEQGLLGLAFHPTYATTGRFFLHYSGKDGQTVVEERVRGANPDVAATGDGKIVLTQAQPESNHNGGALEFGPDGFLYLGLGDGGGGGDQHGAKGNGQDLGTLLGKILRLDVDNPGGGKPYGIPAGNLVAADAKPEIWDYGLRNPWRFSFDACTGDLWVGDVGQGVWEEIDFEPKAAGNRNYGWRAREGKHCFDSALCSSDDPQPGMVDPVLEYKHEMGRCSVTGGYVYRGSAVPSLRGAYFYGDYCTHEIFTTRIVGGVATPPENVTAAIGGSGLGNILSFGQDNLGELYVTTTSGVFVLEAAPLAPPSSARGPPRRCAPSPARSALGQRRAGCERAAKVSTRKRARRETAPSSRILVEINVARRVL